MSESELDVCKGAGENSGDDDSEGSEILDVESFCASSCRSSGLLAEIWKFLDADPGKVLVILVSCDLPCSACARDGARDGPAKETNESRSLR